MMHILIDLFHAITGTVWDVLPMAVIILSVQLWAPSSFWQRFTKSHIK